MINSVLTITLVTLAFTLAYYTAFKMSLNIKLTIRILGHILIAIDYLCLFIVLLKFFNLNVFI